LGRQPLIQPVGPTNLTGPADHVAPQPSPPTLLPFCFLSLMSGAGLSVSPPIHRLPPFLPLQTSWRRANAPASRPGARDGTAPPLGRPARRATRARAWVGSSREGAITHLPPRRAPLRLGLRGGGGCHLGRSGGETGGRTGFSHHLARRRASKARERSNPSRQATNPVGVFSSPLPLRAPEEKRKEGAPPPRRDGRTASRPRARSRS
jgi:hypothetical protein